MPPVGRVVAGVVLVGIAALLSTGGYLGVSHAPGTAAPNGVRSFVGPAGGSTWTPPLGFTAWNTSSLAPNPSSSPPPTSAIIASPPPVPPPTTPVVETLLTNSTITTLKENVTLPAGPWAMILLNYTGTAVGGVYDSSFRVYLNQSIVMLGTTPEYGTWNVVKDVTEYSAFFTSSVNVTYLLGAATTGGHFVSSLSLWLYPTGPGAPAPNEPTAIIPLWSLVSVSTGHPRVYTDAYVPTDATNATLELWAYGFGATEEFWYLNEPAFRQIDIAVNGTPFATALPFQYINTGGKDLYTWRPITAAFTLDDVPLELNETAGLGLLEGSVNLTASLYGIGPANNWILSGSLLLWTNPQANPSTWLNGSYSYSSPAPTIGVSGSLYSETETSSYSYASSVGYPTGAQTVTLFRNVTYASQITAGQLWLGATWENLSTSEVATETTLSATGAGTAWETRDWSFPMTGHLGDDFVEISSNNGTYPIYGNDTTYLDGLTQEWSDALSRHGTAPGSDYRSTQAEAVAATNNILLDEEELTAPGAGLILQYYLIDSQTTKAYQSTIGGGASGGSYLHLLVGAAYQPSDPNGAESVLVNAVSSPVVGLLTASLSTLDVGQVITFTTRAWSGTPPYSYRWSGLPPGCGGATGPTETCSPSSAGTYTATSYVEDATGALAAPSTVTVRVNPLPTGTLTAQRQDVNVNVPSNVTLSASGGTGTLTCTWTVQGVVVATARSCALPYEFESSVGGSFAISVQITDSIGGQSTVVLGSAILVSIALTVTLSAPPGTVTADMPIVLATSYVGSTGGLVYTWFLNGSVLGGDTGDTLSFVPLGAGNYSFMVDLSDNGGGTASSATVVVEVLPANRTTLPTNPTGGSGTSGSSGASTTDIALYIVVGIVIGVVVGALLMRMIPPPRPRPVRPPPRRMPPPSRPPPSARAPPPTQGAT